MKRKHPIRFSCSGVYGLGFCIKFSWHDLALIPITQLAEQDWIRLFRRTPELERGIVSKNSYDSHRPPIRTPNPKNNLLDSAVRRLLCNCVPQLGFVSLLPQSRQVSSYPRPGRLQGRPFTQTEPHPFRRRCWSCWPPTRVPCTKTAPTDSQSTGPCKHFSSTKS